jgi:hypothetical protein
MLACMPTQPGAGLAQARAMSRELGAPEMVHAAGWPDPYEETPELQWPLSLRVYDRMRRQSSHVRAMIRAINLLILQTPTSLRGTTVREEVRRLVQNELGLTPDEEGRRRSREGGVSFDSTLRHALLHLVFGFMPMELSADIGPPDAGFPGAGGPEVAHLVVSPRMPRSVEYIDVNPDGSLIGIRQWIRRSSLRATYTPEQLGAARTGASPGAGTWPNASGFVAPGSDLALQPIPASNLAYFVNEQEGADWAGQSILRSAYKHWLISDFLMRVDANAADRNGTGLPVVTYPADTPGARAKALRIATAVRTGDEAGVALEQGYELFLKGVEGKVHDTLKSIEYHDQAMSRGMLEMFLNLGHDGGLGHGSLGETFVDYFLLSIRSVLRYLEEVITEQIIRPLVRWNFGADEAYPTMTFDDPSAESTPTAQSLQYLAQAGLLIGDPGARAEIRRRYGMPPEEPDVVSVPFLLPRGVTDPLAPTSEPPPGPVALPDGPFVYPQGGGPPLRPAPAPAPPGGPPPPRGVPALPVGGAAVDRRGRALSAGLPVGVALAGGIVGGTVVAVDSPHQVRVDVAGIVGAFTPSECQIRGYRTVAPPPAGQPLDDLLARAHRLTQHLSALAEARPYGDVTYADPGYQTDGRARYPLDTTEHVRAAISYIGQPGNRAAYTARQLQLIEARIRAAARRFGIETAGAS